MARFTVMGFTEAELGFVLAGTFAAVAGVKATAAHEASARQSATQTRALKDSARADSLQVILDSLRGAADREAKRSNLTPPCSEKGESDRPIATVYVAGASSFVVDGESMSIQQLREHLGTQRLRSRALGCKYLIALFAQSGRSAEEYKSARRLLLRDFYVLD